METFKQATAVARFSTTAAASSKLVLSEIFVAVNSDARAYLWKEP
jgi:hypothetical protein